MLKNNLQIAAIQFDIKWESKHKNREIIEKYLDDRNALKLLKQERQVALDVLKFETSQKLFSSENKWIFNGKIETINSTKDLYIKVSDICDFIYSKTPKYDNELINRNILSSPILTARRALLNQILDLSLLMT